MDRFLLIERDGVINVKLDTGVKSLDEFHLLPFVQEAFLTLEQNDIRAIVLSDQGALANQIDPETLDGIHTRMKDFIEEAGGTLFDTIVNPNTLLPVNVCALPQPGLLHLAARKHKFDIKGAFFLTSHYDGLRAGWAAGCQTAYIRSGKPYKTDIKLIDSPQKPDMTRRDILDAVVRIIQKSKSDG